jgi:hypothetical protein
MKVVKRMLPDIIYFCLSGQITIWLISLLGSTTALAQIGALGRIAMIFNLFGGLFQSLVLPRFSRLKNDKSKLLKVFIQTQVGLLLVNLFIIFSVWLLTPQLIWTLGEHYKDLTKPLQLFIVGSSIGAMSGLTFFMSTSRGWIINPFANIIISVSALTVGILVFDVSKLTGVLMLNIFTASIQLLMHFTYGFFRISKLENGSF